MSKPTKADVVVEEPAYEPAETSPAEPIDAPPTVGLEEWCRRASQGSSSVESLAGFYADAMARGLTQATTAEFLAAYEAFGIRPA